MHAHFDRLLHVDAEGGDDPADTEVTFVVLLGHKLFYGDRNHETTSLATALYNMEKVNCIPLSIIVLVDTHYPACDEQLTHALWLESATWGVFGAFFYVLRRYVIGIRRYRDSFKFQPPRGIFYMRLMENLNAVFKVPK